MGNKNRRLPKQPQPSPTTPVIQRITEVRRAFELEILLERRSQAAILSEIRAQNGGDITAEESYRLLAIRRESVLKATI